MGGDSGSAWMAVTQEGAADDMMIGLHFGGETSEPAEYALACYASSVFEKLEVSPIDLPVEEVVSAIESVAAGFNLDFLPNHRLALPTTRKTRIKTDYAQTKDRRTRSQLHAFLTSDECVTALLPLGCLEYRRLRAASPSARAHEVQARRCL